MKPPQNKKKRPSTGSPYVQKRVGIPSRSSVPQVKWTGVHPLKDEWGHEIKRFYQPETLAGAVEKRLHENDRFIIPSIQEIIGPSPVVSLVFELYREDRFKFTFRVHAINARKHRGVFALVAAKQDGDTSSLAETEHKNLYYLNQKSRDSVVRPLRGGYVYLPDRLKRREKGREVYVYLTQWLRGYHDLGVNKDLQFYSKTAKPRVFSKNQTEAIKGSIVEIVAKTYDDHKAVCIEMPQVALGDIVATNPTQGVPQLKLISCRRVYDQVQPDRLVELILKSEWKHGDSILRLAPFEPEALRDALAHAMGSDTALRWIRLYRMALEHNRRKRPDWTKGIDYLERLFQS